MKNQTYSAHILVQIHSSCCPGVECKQEDNLFELSVADSQEAHMGCWESVHIFWITRLTCSDWSDSEIPSLRPHCYLIAGVPETNEQTNQKKDTQEEEHLC